jgi:hypothetical protein
LGRPARKAQLPRSVPALELLEDRVLLNNRFVVPGTPENVNSFNTLQAALTTPGLKAGDIIQIEPSSSPGSILNAYIPNVPNLTLQGDPAADLQVIPQFALDDGLNMGAARKGFTFKHLQFDVLGGTLQFSADDAIVGCQIYNTYAGDAIQLVATSAFELTGSTIVNSTALNPHHNLIQVLPASDSHNQVTDNQFLAPFDVDVTLLDFQGGGGRSTNLVAHNTFSGFTGYSPLLRVMSSQGLKVLQNSFLEQGSNANALEILEDSFTAIYNNDISIPNPGDPSSGIYLQTDSQAHVQYSIIVGNRIETGGSSLGINFYSTAANIELKACVQGNDLQNNGTGVSINTVAGQSATSIDLGGGPNNSHGGNDFRGDRQTILIQSPVAEGPIQARMNIFGVSDPASGIFDYHDDPSVASVTTAGALTGDAAFVETLYLDFLHRPGDATNTNDAGRWVVLMSLGMPAAQVVNQLARSSEALGWQVEAAFQQFLGRDVDAAAKAYFVGAIQSGGTLESLDNALAASSEYQAHFATDAAFVQSLYQNLLQRTGSSGEVGQIVGQLASIGRAGAAQEFLFSQEYRGLQVTDDYTNLLQRDQPPAAAEVSYWVGSGLDLLTLDTIFAATQEFQQNG